MRLTTADPNERLFGAIIPLPSPFGLPAFDPADIERFALAHTVFDPGSPSSDFRAPLTAVLEPGDYGIVFGSGAFVSGGNPAVRTHGSGSMISNNFGIVSYFATGDVFGNVWAEQGVGQLSDRALRFVVEGTPLGESFAVIDFESAEGIVFTLVNASLGNSYREDGFTLTSPGPEQVQFGLNTIFSSGGLFLDPTYTGSVSVYNNRLILPSVSGVVILTQDNGLPFTLHSLDGISWGSTFDPIASEVTFTGVRTDGSVVAQTFFSEGRPRGVLETFRLNNDFADVVSASWERPTNPDGLTIFTFQFDNIIASSSEFPLTPTDLRGIPGNRMVDMRWDSRVEEPKGWNVYFRQKSVPQLGWTRILNLAQPNDASIPTTATINYRVNLNPLSTDEKLLSNGTAYEFSVAVVTQLGVESEKSLPFTAVPRIGNPDNSKPEFPILFLHGLASDASTWDETKAFLSETYGWVFGGELGITGDCTLETPCADFHGEGFKGDFYTATFGDNNANYVNGDGIVQQGREVKAFLQRLRQGDLFPVVQKFIVVAHSMGSLAARSYIQQLGNTAFENDIDRLVTYGTPHQGSPLTELLALIENNAVANFYLSGAADLTPIDPGGAAARDLTPGSAFLTQLNNTSLSFVDYTSIVSFAECGFAIDPGFVNALIFDILGVSDCLVPVDSQNLRNVVIGSPEIENRINVVIANRWHLEETADYNKILDGLEMALKIAAFSPVDLEITGPNGLRISKTLAEIPGASYEEFDSDGDGHPNDIITIPLPLAGDYAIRIVPEDDATPSDTYTLESTLNGVTTVLAQDRQIQDIPSQPFMVNVPEPFDAFAAKVEIEDDEFEVKGRFTLGDASNGIDPTSEEVIFKIGTFSASMPPGSFERDDHSFEFEGIIDGVELEMKIKPRRNGAFTLKVEGDDVDLTGTINPVEVTLTIGDDGGTIRVNAEIELDDDDEDGDDDDDKDKHKDKDKHDDDDRKGKRRK